MDRSDRASRYPAECGDLGRRPLHCGGHRQIRVSPDGISWTFVDAPFWSSSVAWSGTRAVASGHYSPDGLTWTPVQGDWFGGEKVVWDGSRFVVGNGTFIGVSPDGITGTRVLTPPLYLGGIIDTEQGLVGMASSPNASGSALHSSVDGSNWTPVGGVLPSGIKALAASPRQLMAVGEGGAVYTSSAIDSLPFFTQLSAEGYSPASDLTMEGDANGDGISNAVAYYFGLPLDSPGSTADRERLPVLRTREDGGRELIFRLAEEEAPDFMDLAIERSGDLGSWQEVAKRAPGGIWSNPEVSETITGGFREVTLPVTVTEDPAFWRLKPTVRP
jgi:hypothetical protein